MPEYEWNEDNSRVTVSEAVGEAAVLSIHVPVEDVREWIADAAIYGDRGPWLDEGPPVLLVECVWSDERVVARPLAHLLARWLEDHLPHDPVAGPEAVAAMRALLEALENNR